MAKIYLDRMTQLISDIDLANAVAVELEVRHFFSGAALYANEVVCASWSPMGLAFKLPDSEADKLIASSKAKPLKYFEKGHVKKGYAVFEDPEGSKKTRWKNYFLKAIEQAS